MQVFARFAGDGEPHPRLIAAGKLQRRAGGVDVAVLPPMIIQWIAVGVSRTAGVQFNALPGG